MGTVLSNMSPTPDNLVSALLPLFLLCKPGILDRNKTEMNLWNLDVGTNSSNDLKHYTRDISTTTTTSAPAQRSEKEFEQKNPFITLFSLLIFHYLYHSKKYEKRVDYHENCHLQASTMSKHFEAMQTVEI